MTTEDKKELKKRIKELIKQGEKELINLEDSAKPISPENAIGRISRMDAINNRGVAQAALRGKKKKIGKLKVALANINQEGFGTCKSCKRPIAPLRIMYMPESTKCVNCAR